MDQLPRKMMKNAIPPKAGFAEALQRTSSPFLSFSRIPRVRANRRNTEFRSSENTNAPKNSPERIRKSWTLVYMTGQVFQLNRDSGTPWRSFSLSTGSRTSQSMPNAGSFQRSVRSEGLS